MIYWSQQICFFIPTLPLGNYKTLVTIVKHSESQLPDLKNGGYNMSHRFLVNIKILYIRQISKYLIKANIKQIWLPFPFLPLVRTASISSQLETFFKFILFSWPFFQRQNPLSMFSVPLTPVPIVAWLHKNKFEFIDHVFHSLLGDLGIVS